MWSKVLGNESNIKILAIEGDADGNFILTAHANGFNIDNCDDSSDSRLNTIFFFNSDFECQWYRKIGEGINQGQLATFTNALEVGNDGIFVASYTWEDIEIASDSIAAQRYYIAKINFNGVWQWGVELPENFRSSVYIPFPMSSDNQGGLIISGGYEGRNAQVGGIQISHGFESTSGVWTFVARIGSTGTFMWANSFTNNCETPDSIEVIGQNSVYWIGTTCGEQWGIIEYNLTGELVRSQVLQLPWHPFGYWVSSAVSIMDSNDSIIITGILTSDASEPVVRRTILTQIDLSNLETSSTTLLYEGEESQTAIPFILSGEACAFQTNGYSNQVGCYSGGIINWSWDGLEMTYNGNSISVILAFSIGHYTYIKTGPSTITKIRSPTIVDGDNDGIYDIYDRCLGTLSGATADESGCSWHQYDWDDDGIVNSEDSCPKIVTDYCGTAGDYVSLQFPYPFVSEFVDEDELVEWHGYLHDFDISSDGNKIAIFMTSGWNFMLNHKGETLYHWNDNFGDKRVNVMFNHNDSMFFVLTEGQFRAYDSTNYSLLYTNGDDEGCEIGNLHMTLSQNGKNLIFQAPCQSLDWVKINLETWESSVVDPSSLAVYSYDGDYYYWSGKFVKSDGTSVSSSPNQLEFFMKDQQTSNLDSSNILQVVEVENISDYWPIGDQSSIFLVIPESNDREPNQHYRFELGVYNSTIGSISNLFPHGVFSDATMNYQNVYAKMSQDGSRIIAIGTNCCGSSGGRQVLEAIEIAERDRDSDGFVDSQDLCPWEPGQFSGCLEEFFDTDEDGINDKDDQCAGTVDGAIVDSIGCASTQIDNDADGISDATDQCPNTPNGESVGLTGCSPTQVDSDGDGVYDSDDDCPSTPNGSSVDASGCASGDVVDLDSDSDGVRDSIDQCSNTDSGVIVDASGCETEGDVQGASNDELSDAYAIIGCLFLIGIIAAIAFVVRNVNTPSSTPMYDTNYNDFDKSESGVEMYSVMEELEQQRARAQVEAQRLRLELDEQSISASQMATMQTELANLLQRVEDSEHVKRKMEQEMEEMRKKGDSSFLMQDSVVAGDALVGSTKIESQTNINDPEAIARAAIEAYRMAKSEDKD